MALGINTNVASINAQNQLGKSQGQNDQALERLSSGLRINSAKDDAAGLAISTRFESQINGLNQASRNANDGISLSQTAEGALDEVTNNLQRVRDLSVQAANATNSESDRQALNDEVQQRIEEIDRISSETSFNGLNVLDGSLETQDFQVGANVGQTIGVDLSQGTRADQVGSIASDTLEVGSSQIDSSNDVSIKVGDNDFVQVQDSEATKDSEGNVINGLEADSALAKADAIKGSEVEGLNVSASNEKTLNVTDFTSDNLSGDDVYSLNVNGEEVYSLDVANGAGDDVDNQIDAEDIASGINAKSGSTGVTAEVDDDKNLVMKAEDGRNINVGQRLSESADNELGGEEGLTLDSESTVIGNGEDGSDQANSQTLYGEISYSADEKVSFESANDSLSDTLGLNDSSSDSIDVNTEEALGDVDISSVSGANDSILRVDSALESVNSLRSELGATQNRFESTIANIDNNSENLEASNSRIKDADFAAESAKLSQSQVLQQAGISVLSQANQRPQQVLSLLQ